MSTALIITDVQNDFCEGGSLAVAGGAAVAAAIADYVAAQGAGYDQIVATRDYHENPGPHFSATPDYVDSWPPHCVVGTAGAAFRPELDIAPVAAVFSKGRHAAAYSGFEGAAPDGSGLADWLRAHGVDAVDVVGIATDHCVRATAADAARAGFRTTVLLDLTAGVARETTTRALAELDKAGVVLTGEPVVHD